MGSRAREQARAVHASDDVHADAMESLPGEADAGEPLRRTALRDFSATDKTTRRVGTTYRLTLSSDDAPVPVLLRYALTLIGLEARGPGEKVAWWVNFTYRGEWCELAHQKFGLRLYLRTERPEEEARKTQLQIVKQLRSSVHTAERLILEAAPGLLSQGHATVINQHFSLRRAYDYFRQRAVEPILVEDKHEEIEAEPGSLLLGGWSFTSGAIQMQMNAVHDMIAAISAYLSLLEHDLVLCLNTTWSSPSLFATSTQTTTTSRP